MSYTVTVKSRPTIAGERAIVCDARGEVLASVQPDTYGEPRWEAWRPKRDGSWEWVCYGDTMDSTLAAIGYPREGAR